MLSFKKLHFYRHWVTLGVGNDRKVMDWFGSDMEMHDGFIIYILLLLKDLYKKLDYGHSY